MNIKIWVWEVGWGKYPMNFYVGVASVTPRTLSLYHTLFSCNFAILAILDVCKFL